MPGVRNRYFLGLALNGIAVLVGVAVLVSEVAIALFYSRPIGSRVTRQLFSAVYSVAGLFVAAMCMIYSRRLLKRVFGC